MSFIPIHNPLAYLSKNILSILKLSFCVLCFFYSSVVKADLSGLPNVTIFATSSFTYPLVEISRLYSSKNNMSISVSFDSTAEQVRKILEGDQADIFISSHPRWMNELKQNGLIDVFSLTNIAHNRLALVSSPDTYIAKRMPKNLSIMDKLLYINKRSTMVLSDPDQTALGIYSKNAIETIGKRHHYALWHDIDKNILRSSGAKDTLYLISHGSRAGIVYYSDAYQNPEVDILAVFEEDTHEPITYQAAVVAGEHMQHARDFLKFLETSPEFAHILTKYGFSPLTHNQQ